MIGKLGKWKIIAIVGVVLLVVAAVAVGRIVFTGIQTEQDSADSTGQ